LIIDDIYIYDSSIYFIGIIIDYDDDRWMDITNRDSIGRLTKYHFWNDGIYLAIIAIFMLIITNY